LLVGGGSAVFVDAPAEFVADVSAAILGATTVGTPFAVPPTWMLPAFWMTSAEKLPLPLTLIPASPALMLPVKAMRSALLSGVSGSARNTARPLPDAGPNGVTVMLP
jgi:hypothetical protein